MNLKFFKYLSTLAIASVALLISCDPDPDSDKNSNLIEQRDVVGLWLTSASEGQNVTTYEFTATSRVYVNETTNGKTTNYDGVYWVDDNNGISGNYSYQMKTRYIDWKVTGFTPYEIKYKLYDNNDFISNESLYKVVTSYVMSTPTMTPDYKKVLSVTKVSDFKSVDESILTVDTKTGELTAVGNGTTYVVVNTSLGWAAIQVEVTPELKPFKELMLGTWIYDNIQEKEWQKTTFVQNNYVYVEWAPNPNYRKIETGDGEYNLSSDNYLTFSIKTPYGLVLPQEWETVELNEYEWTYKVFSDGDSMGQYTGHRLLGTYTMNLNETFTPDYQILVPNYSIFGFSAHHSNILDVNEATGEIKAIGSGRSYVDIRTNIGTAVIEVNVNK